jgi:hypothetical protein
LQRWNSPVQALSQHTPSAQWVDSQSDDIVQEDPFLAGQGASQLLPSPR